MEYKFKQIKLSDAVKLWFAEILKLNFSNFEVKSLRVKLWEKLPKDFDPDTINNRLIRDGHLTLIGLWHVDPRNAMFDYISKIFEIIKDLIHKNPEISTVKAKEIATLACITERDAEIALKLLFELGNFFGSGGGPKEYYGFREAGFRQDNLAYEKFLRFKNLEEEMERFFISRAPSLNIKSEGPIKALFAQNSNTSHEDEEDKKKWYQTNTFKFVIIPLVVALFLGIPAWLSLSNKTDHSPTASTNIFAYVSKDGAILQSKNFPWKISKSKDEEDNVVYIINGRYGDSSAASVFPDNSRNEYIVYNAIDGVAVKFTCPEEEISNFTIKLKY